MPEIGSIEFFFKRKSLYNIMTIGWNFICIFLIQIKYYTFYRYRSGWHIYYNMICAVRPVTQYVLMIHVTLAIECKSCLALCTHLHMVILIQFAIRHT